MINLSDKINEFPPQFNELEKQVQLLEKRVAELEKGRENREIEKK